jgi:hypothetical protein
MGNGSGNVRSPLYRGVNRDVTIRDRPIRYRDVTVTVTIRDPDGLNETEPSDILVGFMGLDSSLGHHPQKGLNLHGDDLGELARMLQAHTALCQLSDMQVRGALELMQQRGYQIVKRVSE